ncbi:hypothetical protein [Anaeromyxobacter oryzae]|uniref:hypothetical protein n=1 Tax=Anaeromyxobacter oryzae TaxID=2918170 RepID=UPI0020BF0E20|nr:hypothetical protein [Anaeromyxobacter oryzae]
MSIRGAIGASRAAAGAVFALAVVSAHPLASGVARASAVESDTASQIIGVTRESAGAVTVTVTPRRHAEGRLFVDIAVTTHTVNDLDKHDLMKSVSLEVEGKSIAPTSAPGLRGHHSRGQLVFPLETLPRSFAITIRGLDEPAVRVLSWP